MKHLAIILTIALPIVWGAAMAGQQVAEMEFTAR